MPGPEVLDIINSASRARMRLLYPDVAIRAERLYSDIFLHTGLEPRMTESVRTFARQAELYAQGRTAPGSIVTNAKPGFSLHHYACAFDTAFIDRKTKKVVDTDSVWQDYGHLAAAQGFDWGGGWKTIHDTPHCELTYGVSLDQMREIYLQKGIVGIFSVFDKKRGVELASEWVGPITKYRLVELGALPA